jgi:hypothetical protein
MPQVGLESTTPVFEQVKPVHAVNRAVTLDRQLKASCTLKNVSFVSHMAYSGVPQFTNHRFSKYCIYVGTPEHFITNSRLNYKGSRVAGLGAEYSLKDRRHVINYYCCLFYLMEPCSD